MDNAVLERFRLPYPYRLHEVIPKGEDLDDKARRIRSVQPVMVRQVNRFRKSLRPRELHSFDLDDVLQELWLELEVKDRHFDPARSKYITFAMRLVQHKLTEIRNRWHIVPGPRDTVARLRGNGRKGSIERVRQTVRETGSLAAEPADMFDGDAPADDRLHRSEMARRSQDAAILALDELERTHLQIAQVLYCCYGIHRDRPMEAGELAESWRMETTQILAMKAEGEKRLKAIVDRMAAEGRLDLVVA